MRICNEIVASVVFDTKGKRKYEENLERNE